MSDQALDDYLNAIGRIPLLTAEEQIILGRAVQAWMADKESDKPCPRIERRGRRAMDRMVKANLRLVVSISSRYMYGAHTLSQMDLIQAGNIGLMRGVEKFDPERGYRCSTYFYWWIRQGISRHIAESGRTIRIPSNHVPKLGRLGQIGAQLEQQLGRSPTRVELAEALGMSSADLGLILSTGFPCRSLDAPVSCANTDDPSPLVEMVAASGAAEPDPEVIELRARLEALPPIQGWLICGAWGIGCAKQMISVLAAAEGLPVKVASNQMRQGMAALRGDRVSGEPLAGPMQSPILPKAPAGKPQGKLLAEPRQLLLSLSAPGSPESPPPRSGGARRGRAR